MARNIVFRGKRLDNGEWVYGDLLHPITSCRIVNYSEIKEDGMIGVDYHYYDVDPNTVGQYTGLSDRNDAQIYEGDILILSDKRVYKETVVVEHGLYGWTFYDPNTATSYSDGSHTYNAVENYRFIFGTGEIVGNIHDNPELIKTV